MGRCDPHSLLPNKLDAFLGTRKPGITFHFVPQQHLYILPLVSSGAHVLFMTLLQVKINLLQNPSSVFSLATLVCRKVTDAIPQIFGDTLSLLMSASLRLVLSFLLLQQSPMILIRHNLSLQRSLPLPLYQPLSLSPHLPLTPHLSYMSTNGGHIHHLFLKTHLLLLWTHTPNPTSELPLALRKGNRSSRNPNPIYACHLDYHRLSPSYYAFVVSLDSISEILAG